MTFDAYTIYCAHQRARGQPEPSREWWDKACKQPHPRKLTDFEKDVETERRDFWGYDT